MKKIVLFITVMFAVSAVVASCSGGNADKEREDAMRKADSLAVVEAAEAESLRLSEQARLDSIRQDSIQSAEAFEKAVKGLESLSSAPNIDKYLKNLGFEGKKKSSTRTEYDPVDEFDREVKVEEYNYTFTAGDKSIKYSCEIEDTLSWGGSIEKITIEGDDGALDNLYKVLKSNTDGKVSKKGNTIIIEQGWA